MGTEKDILQHIIKVEINRMYKISKISYYIKLNILSQLVFIIKNLVFLIKLY